jgi:Raf kinase inhibitor-like YbhB/YbcL family protein
VKLAASALFRLLAAATLGTALAACTTSVQQPAITLRSDAFEDGGSIPSRNTCDGGDVSPQLSWADAPAAAGAFALIVRDPDAGGFVHWVLTDIPADTVELPEGRGDSIGIPGQNDFGRVGWGGPCPPSGEHRYEFTLYALTGPLQLDGAITADDVDRAIGANLVATGRLTGVYARQR